MASLNNNYINQTYHGLIKTLDSLAIDGTLKPLSDGDGNPLPIEVSDTETKFTPASTVDFTGVTVVGLAAGTQGNQGPTGPQGATGAGTQGAQGSAGTTGTQGAQGPTGTQGTQGRQGTNGTVGTQGAQGNQGNNGTAGTQGNQGATGAGTQGAQGNQGPQGIIGVQGATGAGTQGAQGNQGPQGDIGVQGSQGSGVQGAQGDTGAQGNQGPQGIQGSTGISSGATYYFNQSIPSNVAPYKQLSTVPSGGVQQVVTTPLTSLQTGVLVSSYLTPELGFSVIPAGIQRFHFHFLKQAIGHVVEAYATIQIADQNGNPTGPILQTGSTLIGWTDAVTPVEVNCDVTLLTSTINLTDRMIVKIYLTNLDNQARSINFYTEGTAYYSFVVTSVGVVGNQGPQGSQGTQGVQGVQGPQGIDGAQGNQGSQGPQGDTGAQGTIGTQGNQGPQGNQGNTGTGTQGAQGTQGPNAGVAVNDVALGPEISGTIAQTQFFSELIPAGTVANNNSYNIFGRLSALKNVSGTTLIRVYINTVDSFTAGSPTEITTTPGITLATTQNTATVAKQLFVGAYGTAYLKSVSPSDFTGGGGTNALTTTAIDWTVNQYIVFTTTMSSTSNATQMYAFSFTSGNGAGIGAQGPAGSAGTQGAQGPAGTGAQGAQGPDGTPGVTGNQGSQGPDGPQGFQGSGTQGAQGVQGPSGGGGGSVMYDFGKSIDSQKFGIAKTSTTGYVQSTIPSTGQIYTVYGDSFDVDDNVVYFQPFFFKPGDTVNILGTACGYYNAPTNFDFAIYDSAGTNFGPGALIGAAYNIPVTATGFYFATGLGLVLPATGNYGQYWLMIRQQEGLKARIAGAADSGRTVHQYWDIDRLLTPPGYSGWSLGGAIVSGAFPASGSVFTVGGGSESMKAGFIG